MLFLEAVEASGVCDVKSVLQPFAIPFDDSDFLKISEMVSSSESNLYCAGSHVFSDHLLSEVVERLGDHIDTWVNKLITKFEQDRKGSHHQHKKIEADSEWSDSKRGGKKKGGRGSGGKINKSHEVMHEESPAPTIGVPSETLEEWVTKIGAVPEEILVDVVERIESRVDEKIRARLSEIAATHRNTAAQSQKRNLAQLQQQAQSLYTSICMFEDSSSSFPGMFFCLYFLNYALRTELNQYVLRNVGTELANAILSCASETENVHLMKEKQRDATIAALSVELRSGVSSLYNSLRESTLDNFHSAVFDLSSPKTLSLVLKHPDSKARTEMLEKYVAELREQVQVQSEPAAALLSCVLFLLARNGKPVAASGRFVAQLVRQLSDIVDQSLFENLVSCQRLVVHCLKNKDDEVSRDMLMSDIEKLKQAVIS
ncbi:hypothetical protein DICVIV_06833 [Dictyocaulus viviparus]|uniref:E3 UFM1-protein ligase 1 homolog n=1 Tax=Dictyocaulus viviparus TaxID=29172 RepID=A0A0D8XQW7_DICVI|nr:hypothetical protein DICVIV_06833 [Dictyocaulus viviparus]